MSAAWHLPDDVAARVRGGERVALPEEGAAVIPIEDLRLLEAMEEAEDLAALRVAEAEPGEPVPWETLKAELDRDK